MTAPISTEPAPIRVDKSSERCWRVTIDNPPINMLTPELVMSLHQLVGQMEVDPHLCVVLFESANADFFVDHFDSSRASELLIGRGRALEVVLGCNDFDARRLCLFDREAVRTAKRQVNRHTLPMNGDIESSYLLYLQSLSWPGAADRRAEALSRGRNQAGDYELNLGHHLGLAGPSAARSSRPDS